jgi:Zn-dependent protease with chaperone function
VVALLLLAGLPLGAQRPLSPEQLVSEGRKRFAKKDFGEAARLFSRVLAVPGADATTTETARALLDQSRERFLNTWYAQAGFYESNESRLGDFRVTPEYEMGLGRSVSITNTVSSDAAAQQHLQQLLARLIQGTPQAGLECAVQLIESENATAVTVPGRMMITTGLLPFLETEGDLAGVMAHELAHLYGHHAARRLLKRARGRLLLNVIGDAVTRAGGGRTAQGVTALAGTLGLELFTRAYERFEESEADRYAAHLMFNAGYNPTALSSVFLRLYRENARQPVRLLSTHPPLPNRIEDLTTYLEAFPLERELAVDSAGFQKAVKHRTPPVQPAPATSAPPAAAPDAPAPRSLPPVTPPSAAALPAVAPPPASLPPVVAAAAMPSTLLGPWKTATGDLALRFSSGPGGIVASLLRVPPRWTRGVAWENDIVIRRLRAVDASTMSGENISAPLNGDCPLLPRTWGPTSIKIDPQGQRMRIDATFYRYSSSPCVWSQEFDTVTFSLAPGAAR